MARGFNSTAGGTQRVEFDPTLSTFVSWPFTLACKLYGTGVNVDGCAWFSACSGTLSQHAMIGWDTSEEPGGRVQFQHWAGSAIALIDDTDFIQNRWYSAVARAHATSSREFDVYDLTADRHANDTNLSQSANDIVNLRFVQGNSIGTSWARGMDGYWAETAAWSVALTDAEVAAYQAGVSPALIRPQSLIFYDPSISGTRPDQIDGASPSAVGSPTDLPHPPGIIYPTSPKAGVIDIGDRTLYEWTSRDMNPGVVSAQRDTRNLHHAFEFDDTVEEYVELTGVMPLKADLDYLGLKLVWTAGSTAGQVVWKAQIQRVIGG